jgi:hypothetical protein
MLMNNDVNGGYWDSILGDKAAGTPPSGVEVKNAKSYTSVPPYVYMTWLVKHQGLFLGNYISLRPSYVFSQVL